MQFVDEASIIVEAGRGGNGCLSFRREKYVPKGGPDGGDGGHGGSVYLVGDDSLNTLIDFKYQRFYQAESGRPGQGRQMSGRAGDDLVVKVPVGTTVIDEDTLEVIADITEIGQQVLVAQGGRRGLGNIHFKSSTNRAPRKTTPGTDGEPAQPAPGDEGNGRCRPAGHAQRRQVDPDSLGVCGQAQGGRLPLHHPGAQPRRGEAGHARALRDGRCAGADRGASDGAGLGLRFLKHLTRTRLLFHVVDVAPFDESDPVEAAQAIAHELEQFSPTLAERPRWLVINKLDLVPEEEREARVAAIVEGLAWEGPVYRISAISGEGTDALVQAAHRWLTEQRRLEHEDEEAAEREREMRERMEAEAVARTEARLGRKRKHRDQDDDDDFDDDDYDVEVEYVE